MAPVIERPPAGMRPGVASGYAGSSVFIFELMTVRDSVLIAVIFLLAGALGACANSPAATPTPTANPRPTDISIAVPGQRNMLSQRLRRTLGERGWSLTHYDPDTLQGSRDYDRIAQRARYRLTLKANRIGDCRSGEPSFLYNLALIENASGNVRLALAGASCLSTIIERFQADLDRKQPVVPGAADAQ